MATLLLIGSFILVCGIVMGILIQGIPVGYFLPMALGLFGIIIAGYSLQALLVLYNPAHPFYPFYQHYVGRKYGGMAEMRKSLYWQIALGIFLVVCGVAMAIAQYKG